MIISPFRQRCKADIYARFLQYRRPRPTRQLNSPNSSTTNFPFPNLYSRQYSSILPAHDNIPLTALITGASSSIGSAIAYRLACGPHFPPHRFSDVLPELTYPHVSEPPHNRPMLCTLVGRNSDTLQKTLSTLPTFSTDLNHRYVNGDVCDPQFWIDLSHGEIRAFNMRGEDVGPAFCGGKTGGKNISTAAGVIDNPNTPAHLDCLINAAGLAHSSLLHKTDISMMKEVMSTNLMAVMYSVTALTGLLLKSPGRKWPNNTKTTSSDSYIPPRPSPCIISVSSILARRFGRGTAAYAASKAGLEGLIRALAIEMGPLKIRVSGVAPGWVSNSGMAQDFLDTQQVKEKIRQIPLGRFATPEEISDAIEFLITSEYFTGGVINLDGGLSSV